jgi:hypothetical protein
VAFAAEGAEGYAFRPVWNEPIVVSLNVVMPQRRASYVLCRLLSGTGFAPVVALSLLLFGCSRALLPDSIPAARLSWYGLPIDSVPAAHWLFARFAI